MLRLLAIVFVALICTPVEARHHAYRFRIIAHHGRTVPMGLVTVPTAANIPITVASHLAVQFQSLIADLVTAGYKPKRISCFATSGHVPNSRHYAGAACDFDGSLSRSKFMRSSLANTLIHRYHLRNGCSFYCGGVRDCGHVDDGRITRHHPRTYSMFYSYSWFPMRRHGRGR
jgi:hypothetical protein